MVLDIHSLKSIGACLGCPCEEHLISGYSIDSRDVKKGDLFFALRGQKFDGHDFLQQIGKKGAVAAVVHQSYRGETGGVILLRVEDVTAALQKLARETQKLRSQRIVGITGSVGKTTTKEFLSILLSQKYSVAKTPGNSNSQVGFPLAILQGTGKEEVFIAEMSMSDFHHIEKLVAIAPPEIAMITKVGFSHVDTVPNGLEGVAAAKAEILMHPATKIAVIEAGAFQFPVIQGSGSAEKVTYGVDPVHADMVLEPGWRLNYHDELTPTFRLPFSETHFCENFVGAATVARLMGLSWEEIIKGAHALKSIQLRFEKIDRDGVTIINDSYNASPESMKAAIDNLPRPAFGAKTILVLGEMMTLGKYSEEGHKKVGEQAVLKGDHLLCYGKGCAPILQIFNDAGKPAEFFHNLQELKKTLFELSKPGDVILIKGSNGNKLWSILG